MKLNADFDRMITIHSQDILWVESPTPGVDRKMLDRIGEEKARATSIVRYAAGSSFPEHTHSGGEEFLVLEGVFQDEHGDYPAGTYVRNPPTSRHTPKSDKGCIIFVKLWQFNMSDRHQLSVNSTVKEFNCIGSGVSEIPLYEDTRERVRIELWNAATIVDIPAHTGMEILVLEGQFLLVVKFINLNPGCVCL